MGRTLRDLAPFASELTPLGSRHEFTACVHEWSKFERGTSDDDIFGRHSFTVLAPSQ